MEAELIISIVSTTVCFLLGIMLLTINTFTVSFKSTYNSIKRLLGYSIFLAGLVNLLIIITIRVGGNPAIYDKFIIPCVVYLQSCMITMALLRMIHSKSLSVNRIRFFGYIGLALIVSYLIFLISNKGFKTFHDYELYKEFTETTTYRIYSIIVYSIIIISFNIFCYTLIVEGKKYLKNLNEVYAGQEISQGSRLYSMIIGFIVFFLITIIGVVVKDTTVDVIFKIIDLAILVTYVILLINLQKVYIQVSSQMPSLESRDDKDESNPEIEEEEEDIDLMKLIHEWENSDNKGYLQESLTIATVAESIGINPRMLSQLLNNVYSKNFNLWINGLRIEEAKRIIKRNPNISFKELSVDTGFSDSAAMSKSFKAITGVTPTEYKNSIKNL